MDASGDDFTITSDGEEEPAGERYLRTEYERRVTQSGNEAIGLLFWGLVNLFSGNFPFASVLGILAVVGTKLRSAARFAVYGIFLLWAALLNLIAIGDGTAIFWAIVMTLSALWELRLFARCQREEEAYLQAHSDDQHHLIRSRQRLPGAAAAIALIAWVVYATSWLLFFIWTVWHAPDSGDPPILFTFLNSVSPMAGAVGLAMGGAALLSRYPHKLFAVAAVLSGGGLVAVQFSLLVLAP